MNNPTTGPAVESNNTNATPPLTDDNKINNKKPIERTRLLSVIGLIIVGLALFMDTLLVFTYFFLIFNSIAKFSLWGLIYGFFGITSYALLILLLLKLIKLSGINQSTDIVNVKNWTKSVLVLGTIGLISSLVSLSLFAILAFVVTLIFYFFMKKKIKEIESWQSQHTIQADTNSRIHNQINNNQVAPNTFDKLVFYQCYLDIISKGKSIMYMGILLAFIAALLYLLAFTSLGKTSTSIFGLYFMVLATIFLIGALIYLFSGIKAKKGDLSAINQTNVLMNAALVYTIIIIITSLGGGILFLIIIIEAVKAKAAISTLKQTLQLIPTQNGNQNNIITELAVDPEVQAYIAERKRNHKWYKFKIV